MRIGISVASFHDVDDPREATRRMVARTRSAAEAGLGSLFVGDHHVTPKPYLQNTAILGRLLAEWDARPCGALYLLPLWHPVLLAEQVATLAAIAEGPFVLQCALGEADRQYEALGVDGRHRPSRFEECLDAARRLWLGEEVSSEGRYRFSRARISPIPHPPVDVWIGASAPPAIDRAARLGDGWIASPHLTVEQAKEQLQTYRSACERHGRPPGRAVIRRDVYVGADETDVERRAGPILASGHRGFPAEALVAGTIDIVSAAFGELQAIGYDEVLVRSLVADPPAACDSIARLSEVRTRVAPGD